MRAVRIIVLAVVPIALALTTAIPPAASGPPGRWTKVSTGSVGSINEPGLYRTSDGVLHVVYSRSAPGSKETIGHTAIKPSGVTKLQNIALPSPWEGVVTDPKVIGRPGGGLRLVFGGLRTLNPGDYWTDGRMYTALGNGAGTSWQLPMQAIGQSGYAYASYGTGAVTLADGTPIASYPLNSDLTWHVGTGEATPDQVFTFPGASIYGSTLVRAGGKVYAGFQTLASTAPKTGTFVKQIYPTRGPTLKAPGSSQGSDTLGNGQATALTVRKGGGVFLAYCVGWPTCKYIALWKVGTNKVLRVPRSGDAFYIALSAGPAGRLWIAWEWNGKVRAVRTGTTGLKFGAVQTLRAPRGMPYIYRVAIEGSRGKGDIVINTGEGLYHQQLLPGLSLSAKPRSWPSGQRQRVVFTVTDARVPLANARVTVGSRDCVTGGAGTCSIRFPRLDPGKLTAVAKKSGYGKATLTLRVRG